MSVVLRPSGVLSLNLGILAHDGEYAIYCPKKRAKSKCFANKPRLDLYKL